MSKILSVNGNKAMSFLLQTIFEKEYQVIPVADVFQAMLALKTGEEFTAVLVDVDFQPQQTWDFVQHIKSSKLLDVPVLVLATANSEELKLKTYQYEVDDIFFKPFNPIDLVLAVKNLSPSKALVEA